MTRQTLELVGVQVTHSKPTGMYRIDNVYARAPVDVFSGCAIMKGYDLALVEDFALVARAMMDAYAPAIETIWRQDTKRIARYYLQFYPTYGPRRCGTAGSWKVWAIK